jgi:acetolactate synthase-1/2/3 large subunit
MELPLDFDRNDDFHAALERLGPQAFIVPIDPEQTYFPKISSRITESGSMESNPIDRMTPDLPEGWLKALKKPETVKQ